MLSEFLLAIQNLSEERNKKLVCGAFVEGKEVKRELFSYVENYLNLFHFSFSKLILKINRMVENCKLPSFLPSFL
ncbi:hypothetical protein ACQP3L_37150, partial [Escherichia coli]